MRDAIQRYGGNVDSPEDRDIARQLVKERDDITRTLAGNFKANFFGEDFSFDAKEDSQRFNLANQMIPFMMMGKKLEQGEAIKQATDLANFLIPQEEDVFDAAQKQEGKKGTEGKKEGNQQKQEESSGLIDSLTSFFSGDDKKEDTQVIGNAKTTAGRIPVKVSNTAISKAEQGDTRPLIQELTAIFDGDENKATQWLMDNDLIEED
jgi:hypothetical protein